MRKITLAVIIVGSLLAGHASYKMLHREITQEGLDWSTPAPAKADFLLVKDHAGWPADMKKFPLSQVGNWRVECDGSLYDYRDISLGAATDRAHDLGCQAWEVSAIDGLS